MGNLGLRGEAIDNAGCSCIEPGLKTINAVGHVCGAAVSLVCMLYCGGQTESIENIGEVLGEFRFGF